MADKTLMSLAVKISVDASELTDGLGKAQESVKKTADEIKEGVTDLSKETEKTKSIVSDIGTVFLGVGAGVYAIQEGIDAVKTVYDEILKPTIEYTNQIEELARMTGVSAEETSRLIQVADDLNVDFKILETSAKALAKEGINLTVDQLAKMSDEYLALAPGAERVTYLTDNFGASATEMGALLAEGSTEIRGMAAAVNENLVITQDAIDNAQEFDQAIKELGKTIDGLEVKLSGQLFPTLTNIASALNDAIKDTKINIGDIIDITEHVKFWYNFFSGLFGENKATKEQSVLLEGLGIAPVNPYPSGLGTIPMGAGHAAGGSFMVPSGFPNDTFPMRVSSGEHVTVTPPGSFREFDYNKLGRVITESVMQGMG